MWVVNCMHHEGSAPRGADARPLRSREEEYDKVRSGQKKEANDLVQLTILIILRATYAGVIALCCAVCMLAVSRSVGQYGCNLRGGGHEDRERTTSEESKKTNTQQLTRTCRYII